jgi:hypothetical protein
MMKLIHGQPIQLKRLAAEVEVRKSSAPPKK